MRIFQGTTGVRLPGAQARVAVPGRQFIPSLCGLSTIFFDEDCQGTTGVRFPGAQARVAVPGRQSEA